MTHVKNEQEIDTNIRAKPKETKLGKTLVSSQCYGE